jgi:hypothetical protein
MKSTEPVTSGSSKTPAARGGIAMKYQIRRFKSMAVALPELRQIIHCPALLENGRPVEKFGGLRPRELVGNWLVCAVVNFERGREDLCFTTDPTTNDCDGLIFDDATKDTFFTEHVFISQRDEGDAELLILERVAQKNAKGATYARGRTLMVFANGGAGEWFPNRVAKKIGRPFHFDDVWLISLQNAGTGGSYIYGVARLDPDAGEASIWHVQVPPEFDRWDVRRVQQPPVFPLLGRTGPCCPGLK